jgi:hypothetical protein
MKAYRSTEVTDSNWIRLTGNELGRVDTTKVLRKVAMAHAEQFLIGNSFINMNTGHAIKVTRQRIKHSIARANVVELKIIPAIGQLLETAFHSGLESDKKNRPHIKAIHKYIVVVYVNKERLNLGIVTRQTINGHEHYDHFIVGEKENPRWYIRL